jgi:hypothetical protein
MLHYVGAYAMFCGDMILLLAGLLWDSFTYFGCFKIATLVVISFFAVWCENTHPNVF